jgi:hypothetical protein
MVLSTLLTAGLAGADPPPVCNGTVAYCRPCSANDDGQPAGCTGGTAICETNEENPRFGSCVECTSSASCPSTKPVCNTAGVSTDTCRACGADA